jgi:hypothetical protein
MNKMFKKRGIFAAMLLAALMVTSVAGSAFAQTSDPYMMSYEQISGSPYYQYTYDNLQCDASTPRTAEAYLIAGPATSYDLPSYFNTEEDALAVKWSFIDDSSVYVVQFSDTVAYQDIVSGGWVAYAVVDIFDSVTPTQFGSVSIQALNPNATDPDSGENAYVNFTLQINEDGTPPAYTSVPHIGYQVWDPGNIGTSFQAYATTSTTDFYETDTRTYPTVMDGVVQMLYQKIIGAYVPGFGIGLGDNVTSLTVNGTPYPNVGTTRVWLYRVYRQTGPFYTMLPMSSVVGPDAPKLIEGDIVVWRYGDYNDQNLFPATITSCGHRKGNENV